jgi:hypothetical protein
LHQRINDLAILIDCAPQIRLLAFDFYKDLIDEERIAGASVRAPQSACVRGTALVALQPNRFMVNDDVPPEPTNLQYRDA